MKKKFTIFIAFICLCSILSGCVRISKKMALRLKKGEAFRIQIDNSKNFKGPSNESLALKSRKAFLCSVMDVDKAKDMEVKVTIDVFDVNVKVKENIKKYLEDTGFFLDNHKDIYSKFLGKSFKVKITESGKVEKVMGIDDIANSVLKEEQDEKKKELIKDFIKKELSEDVIEDKIERIIGVYSDQKIDVGDTWRKQGKISSNLPIDVEEDYTLKERKEGTSDISIKGKIKKRESASPIKTKDITIEYDDISGIDKGNITIGRENKMIKTEEIESEYKGKIKVMFKDPTKGAEHFPISSKEKITVNVLKQ